jgi:hypothetical protein
LKIVDLELAVAKDFVQQSGADRLARMHRCHGGPPILLTEEVVAAFDPDHGEACLSERCERSEPGTGESGSCRNGDALDSDEL